MAWWEWMVIGAAVGVALWEMHQLREGLTEVDARRIIACDELECRLAAIERRDRGVGGR